MKKITALLLFAAAFFGAQPAYAMVEGPTDNPLLNGIISTVTYSLVGILLAFMSYKIIDFITPGNLGEQIANNNIALAILAGFTKLGICIIIAAVLAS